MIFVPNPIGDAVMATPALRALREHFASARITLLGRPGALELLAGLGLADETIEDFSGRRPKTWNVLRLAGRLRRKHFDLAVLMPNSFRAALLAWLGGAGRIVGYARGWRGRLLSDALAPPRDQRGKLLPTPAIGYYVALAEHLGARCSSRRMGLAATEGFDAEARRILTAAGVGGDSPMVMLNPGASFGPSKLWPAERFAAVADALIERRGAWIVINASAAERRIAADVARAMGQRPAINLAERGNSLGLAKSLIRRCDLMITNDTGARHMAAALGVGVVTIFGSTDPQRSEIDYDRERIVRVHLPCSPCQRKVCPHPAGPTFHQCMLAISPEKVLAAAEELLDRRPAGNAEDRP